MTKVKFISMAPNIEFEYKGTTLRSARVSKKNRCEGCFFKENQKVRICHNFICLPDPVRFPRQKHHLVFKEIILKEYKCTDCQTINLMEDNNEITVGFCCKCDHPLWNKETENEKLQRFIHNAT